jgi:phosphoesterase RecJ-like protein
MPALTQQGRAALHRQIWELLTEGLPVVVTSHIRLDGDAVGSALALWHGLRARGVEAYQAFKQPTPSMFHFLEGLAAESAVPLRLPDRYHLVVLDCGTLDRVGEVAERLGGRARTLNIDHHASNSCFGDLNYVDTDASSCGEMVYGLLRDGGVPLSRDVAECLFTAIVTDTGQFSHEDTTPEALAICAECMRAGAKQHELIRQLFMSPSPAQVKLRHLALGTLRFYDGGRVATMCITREMFRQANIGPQDTEGFAEVPVGIQGVVASALLKELPGCDQIKVSMRSRESVDVCAVARLFGGGGHMHAAGFEVADSLENARQSVAEQLQAQLGPRSPSAETH